MAYEHKPNSGTLFKNSKKEKDTHPNARGEALIGGVLYEVSAWTRKDKNGNPWQSLAFQVKGERTERPVRQPAPAGGMSDDTPF